MRLNSPDEEAVADSRRLVGLVAQPAGVEQMWVTGVPVVYEEFNAVIEEDLRQAEIISLPLAGLILLVVFGTLVGAGLPLLIAGFSLISTFAIIGLLANQADMSIFVTNLATMIGLALAIDYSLFLVSRFREELLHHPVDKAVERTMATVGKAVAVSGIAVAIGLAALIVFEADALRSMGIGGVVVVVATMLFGLTVLPALLAMLGHRVNRLKVPVPRFLRFVEDDPVEAERRLGHGFWSRVAARVMKRPLLIGGPILILLLLAGTPFLRIELSTGGNLEDLPDTPAKEGFIVLRDDFPGGDADPMLAAVTYDVPDLTDGELTPERLADLQAYIDEVTVLDGVLSVESVLDAPAGLPADQYLAVLAMPPDQWPDGLDQWVAQTVAGDTTKVTIFSSRLPDSEEGRGARRRGPRGGRPGRRHGGRRRPGRPLRGLHGQLPGQRPGGGRDRHRGDSHRPVPDLRIGLPAGEGRPHESRLDHRQLRGPGLDLPGGEPVGAAELRGHRIPGRLAADPDVRHPVRAVDGLRSAAPVPDPGAVDRDR